MDALRGFPDQADFIETIKGRATLQKRDIFKNLMWYSFSDSNKQYPLTIERVKEILAENKQGRKPEELQAVELEISNPKAVKVDVGFVNDVGQITLKALEKGNKKKQNKGGNRDNRGGQQGNRPQQQAGGNRPQQQAQGNRPAQQGGGPRPQQAQGNRPPQQGGNKPQQNAGQQKQNPNQNRPSGNNPNANRNNNRPNRPQGGNKPQGGGNQPQGGETPPPQQ
jgi:hypothetical protein